MPNVTVTLERARHSSYTIMIGDGLFQRLPAFLAKHRPMSKVFVIADATVARLYGHRLLQSLAARRVTPFLFTFPVGEASKNMRMVNQLHTAMLGAGVSRDDAVVALGGGVTGDLAGFVAATVLRGVALFQVPTTLLAQVDSSVGGKVGVDHSMGKNLIGAFYQPEAVIVDPVLLRTLPMREFKNGLAEMLKIAAALDARLFRKIERAVPVTKQNSKMLTRLITQCVGLKASVVERDEFEAGLRKSLNLGHTLGHAIEASSDYKIMHGTAVAMGLVGEMEIAFRMGLLRAQDRERVLAVMRALGLPTRFPPIKSRERFLEAVSADKKADAEGPRYVLLNGIGRCVLDVRVDQSLVVSLLNA